MGQTRTAVSFLGHATCLLEIGGLRLITDPVLRDRVAHLQRHAPPPLDSHLLDLDAVLISHLHHDHFDRASLRSLAASRPTVFAPSGSARHLRGLGIESVHELSVGQSVEFNGVQITATHAQHDGRRMPWQQAAGTLGFVVEQRERIYFAGDTDIFDAMVELGPIDLALLPIWGWGPDIGPGHLDPERAAQAAGLIGAKTAVPIHWGTFYPIGMRRLRKPRIAAPASQFAEAATRLAPEVNVVVLEPGESLTLVEGNARA